MKCSDICERLNRILDVEEYRDIDNSKNGLQVGRFNKDIKKIAFAVDAALATINKSIEKKADFLITHHGISWGGIDRVTGYKYDRIASLINGDIGLYTAHLPLDGHMKIGNAAGISEILELENRKLFGQIGNKYIGQEGKLKSKSNLKKLINKLNNSIDTPKNNIKVLDFGPEKVEDIAIVTGSGADWLDEAVEKNIDLFITGEGKQKIYHESREQNINVLLAGHYATEIFGVKSLQKKISNWGLKTIFIDHPTGI